MSGFMRRYSATQDVDQAAVVPVDGGFMSRQGGGAEAAPPARRDFGIDWSQPKEAVRKEIAKLPPEFRRDALNQWADAYVKRERSQPGGVVRYAEDVTRNAARGLMGDYFGRAIAGLESLFGSNDYEETLAYQRGLERAQDAESTKLGTLPVIGDVTVGGVQKLAGGAAGAAILPLVRPFGGSTMLPRAGNYAANGALWGGVAGSGSGDSVGERATNAAIGAGLGGAIGGAAPVVGRAVSGTVGAAGKGAAKLVNALSGGGLRPPAVAGYHPQATRRMVDLVEADNLTRNAMANPQAYETQAANLGWHGMLADMGPKLRGTTSGIGSLPGVEGSIVHRALTDRAQTARGRIGVVLQKHFGPAKDMGAEVKARYDASKAAADPIYDAYRSAPLPDDPAVLAPLPAYLERARKTGALARAKRDMEIEGIDPRAPENLWGLLDYVKRNIDDLMPDATGNRARILTKLRDDIVGLVDKANPHYATARETAAPGLQFRAGAKLGGYDAQTGTLTRRPLRDQLTAEQVSAELRGLPAPGREGYRAAYKESLRSKMDNASTSFGDNGPAAIRRELGDEAARKKLSYVTGRSAAREITNRLDAESTFQNTYNRALTNSETAPRQAVQRDLGYNTDANFFSSFRSTTPTGLATEGVVRIANMLTNGAWSDRKQVIARDMAKMLVAQGADRDQIAKALIGMARSNRLTAQAKQAIDAVISDVIAGSIPQATAATTSAMQPDRTGRQGP